MTKTLRFILLPLAVPVFLVCCHGQNGNTVKMSTADLDLIASGEYGKPAHISSIDTSPGWKQPGVQMMVTGTIFKNDGRTPAPGVELYYYHTNVNGRYLHKAEEARSLPPNEQGQTHGYIRGWVLTDSLGRYTFYTVRPGVYPNRDEPAHIHFTIKDPFANMAYYIDDLVFDDDKLLTTQKKNRMENRGGRGILRMIQKDGLQMGEHNIVLGLNIPAYPGDNKKATRSGLSIGEDQPSFTPYHAYGLDKGSRACPVCKYGRYHGIVYFTSDKSSGDDIEKWLLYLERESAARKKYLNVYLVYLDGKNPDKATRMQQLADLGERLQLKHTALTYVPSVEDKETEAYLNKINPAAENTFIIYKNAEIVDKYINLAPTEVNFLLIQSVLDKTKGSFFD
jgi:protocatechuate 3,4-dioxygenase, beta subunit